MRRAVAITLTDEERARLEEIVRGRAVELRMVQRARIVLLAAEGLDNGSIANRVELDRITVGTWRKRFSEERLDGIAGDRPRSGRKPRVRQEQAPRILEANLRERPEHATHWTVRTLAKHLGVSRSMVERVWRDHDLKPHLVKPFKASNDPRFIERTIDIVGLYVSPPERALVLAADEKSQIQALDRTQPSLPMYPGRLGTMTHDYQRNGTTTLFAAMDVASGVVISKCMKRHRHQEWIRFLKHIDASTDPTLDLHLICDNYATHKHPAVKRWLARHPRFHIHFTPTSSSWLNLIERFFGELTRKRIRRGAFKSVAELEAAIDGFIEHHNERTEKGYLWTKSAEKIIAKYRRARTSLQTINHL